MALPVAAGPAGMAARKAQVLLEGPVDAVDSAVRVDRVALALPVVRTVVLAARLRVVPVALMAGSAALVVVVVPTVLRLVALVVRP